jgi:hypothetical protein
MLDVGALGIPTGGGRRSRSESSPLECRAFLRLHTIRHFNLCEFMKKGSHYIMFLRKTVSSSNRGRNEVEFRPTHRGGEFSITGEAGCGIILILDVRRIKDGYKEETVHDKS